ncbi:hypothetical protein [Shewanella sp. YIC-542]|uniref:hypothetical protein n=1 Tax=Shewanella mytili TaxID=3377111 RepID=UPI00398F200B
MRFAEIKSFSIDDLMLDEGNYRFRKASDQQACIEKIYRSNPTYFSNLMTSLAEEDLGEPLLVYSAEHDAVVLDGNRRTAALKVIRTPELAPTPALKKKAEGLLAKTLFDFDAIHAQVSDSKDKIYQTVYERHASGNGSRRLNWSAIAAARFRFDQKITDDSASWHSTALIFALESKHPDISDFIDGREYSHEVFTRIVRSAISKGIISKDIFIEKQMRLSKQHKNLVDDALNKSKTFLESIKNKELSLSRVGDSYADADKISRYLEKFSLPDVNKLSDSNGNNGKTESNSSRSQSTNSNNGGNSNDLNVDNSNKNESSNSGKVKTTSLPRTIVVSEPFFTELKKLNSSKLEEFYNSLCKISLKSHGSLMCICVWTFIEILSTLLGKEANTSLDGFYKSKINEWYNDKGVRAELKSAIDYIAQQGNLMKHSSVIHSPDSRHLAVHFKAVEPLLLKTIESILQKANK